MSNINPNFSFTTPFTEAVVPVGTVHYDQGRGYVFCLNSGAGTTAVGDVAGCFSAASNTRSYSARAIGEWGPCASTQTL